MYTTPFPLAEPALMTFLMASQAATTPGIVDRLVGPMEEAHRAIRAMKPRWASPSILDMAFGYRLAGDLAKRCATLRTQGWSWATIGERLGMGLADAPFPMLVYGLDMLRSWLPGLQGPLDQDAIDLIDAVHGHRSDDATGTQQRTIAQAVRDQDKREDIEGYRVIQGATQDKRDLFQTLWRHQAGKAHGAVRDLFEKEGLMQAPWSGNAPSLCSSLNNAMAYALADALAWRGAQALADGHALQRVVNVMAQGFDTLDDDLCVYGITSFEACLIAVAQQRPQDDMALRLDGSARAALTRALDVWPPREAPTPTVPRAMRDWQRAVRQGKRVKPSS